MQWPTDNDNNEVFMHFYYMKYTLFQALLSSQDIIFLVLHNGLLKIDESLILCYVCISNNVFAMLNHAVQLNLMLW